MFDNILILNVINSLVNLNQLNYKIKHILQIFIFQIITTYQWNIISIEPNIYEIKDQ